MKRKSRKLSMPKAEKKPILTKKTFHRILDKASQSVKESDSEKS